MDLALPTKVVGHAYCEEMIRDVERGAICMVFKSTFGPMK